MDTLHVLPSASALSTTSHDSTCYPSIFDDSDNVYNTYALPSEDPRKVRHYLVTGANTPRSKKSRA